MAKSREFDFPNEHWKLRLRRRVHDLTHIPVKPIHRLVYQILPDHTIVISVTPEGDITGAVVPNGTGFWEEMIETFRMSLGRSLFSRDIGFVAPAETIHPTPADRGIWRQMYEILICPVASHLPTDAATLLIEPFGALWQIPFHLLQSPDDVFLGDRYNIIYTPSFDIFQKISQEKILPIRRNDSFVFGGIGERQQIGPYTFNSLPHAEEEIETIGRQILSLPARHLFTGEKCTKAEIKASMPGSRFIHLSTHGEANPEQPDQSFLVFSGQTTEEALLTAREIADHRDLLGCELVVLSACKSGLGKTMSEGMIGLARAFLIAGARSVLVSLWSVEDESAKLLMQHFYRALLANGGNKAKALQEAMQEVRRLPGKSEPQYWAPFVLIGAPDCLLDFQ